MELHEFVRDYLKTQEQVVRTHMALAPDVAVMWLERDEYLALPTDTYLTFTSSSTDTTITLLYPGITFDNDVDVLTDSGIFTRTATQIDSSTYQVDVGGVRAIWFKNFRAPNQLFYTVFLHDLPKPAQDLLVNFQSYPEEYMIRVRDAWWSWYVLQRLDMRRFIFAYIAITTGALYAPWDGEIVGYRTADAARKLCVYFRLANGDIKRFTFYSKDGNPLNLSDFRIQPEAVRRGTVLSALELVRQQGAAVETEFEVTLGTDTTLSVVEQGAWYRFYDGTLVEKKPHIVC